MADEKAGPEGLTSEQRLAMIAAVDDLQKAGTLVDTSLQTFQQLVDAVGAGLVRFPEQPLVWCIRLSGELERRAASFRAHVESLRPLVSQELTEVIAHELAAGHALNLPRPPADPEASGKVN